MYRVFPVFHFEKIHHSRRRHFQNSKRGELRLENLHAVSTQNLSENIEKMIII